MDSLLNATNYIDYHYLWGHHKVRFRKAKIVRNLFQKVFILVQKVLLLFCLLFSLNNERMHN